MSSDVSPTSEQVLQALLERLLQIPGVQGVLVLQVVLDEALNDRVELTEMCGESASSIDEFDCEGLMNSRCEKVTCPPHWGPNC